MVTGPMCIPDKLQAVAVWSRIRRIRADGGNLHAYKQHRMHFAEFLNSYSIEFFGEKAKLGRSDSDRASRPRIFYDPTPARTRAMFENIARMSSFGP